MVRVFARVKSRPGHADDLRSLLQKLIQASRAEEGVLTYEVFETEEAGEFLFREEYTDRAAFEKHKVSRHVKVAFGRASAFTDGELTLWIASPIAEGP